MIGKLLQSSQEFQKSLFPLKKTLIINPRNPSTHILLINSLLTLGKENECFSSIKKALSISPEELELRKLALLALGKLNRFEDLLSLYQETAEMMKNKEAVLHLYFHSAEILGTLKMIPQELEQYRKAFGTGAMNSEHHLKYAHVLIREGLPEEAIVQFEHIWKLDPTNRIAINNIASLHYELGRAEKAFEAFEYIMNNGLETNMTYLHFILVLYHLGKDEIIKFYKDRLLHYFQGNKKVMQQFSQVELRETEEKLEGDLDEEAIEFHTKKLKALKRVLSLLPKSSQQ